MYVRKGNTAVEQPKIRHGHSGTLPPILQGPRLRLRDDISTCSRSLRQDLYSLNDTIHANYCHLLYVVCEGSVVLQAQNLSLLANSFHHAVTFTTKMAMPPYSCIRMLRILWTHVKFRTCLGCRRQSGQKPDLPECLLQPYHVEQMAQDVGFLSTIFHWGGVVFCLFASLFLALFLFFELLFVVDGVAI